jgi:hypothetical protein
MLRFATLTLLGGVLAVPFLGTTSAIADGKGDSPSVEEIMKKLHGRAGAHKIIGKSLDAPAPDWAAISTQTKIYVTLANDMTNTKVEKGDAKAWDKLCKEYADLAKELDTAVDKKEKSAAKASFIKLKETCDACHENHR